MLVLFSGHKTYRAIAETRMRVSNIINVLCTTEQAWKEIAENTKKITLKININYEIINLETILINFFLPKTIITHDYRCYGLAYFYFVYKASVDCQKAYIWRGACGSMFPWLALLRCRPLTAHHYWAKPACTHHRHHHTMPLGWWGGIEKKKKTDATSSPWVSPFKQLPSQNTKHTVSYFPHCFLSCEA